MCSWELISLTYGLCAAWVIFLFLAGVRKWNFSVGCECWNECERIFSYCDNRVKDWNRNGKEGSKLELTIWEFYFKFNIFKSLKSSQQIPKIKSTNSLPILLSLSLNTQQKTIIYHVTHEGVKTFLFPHLTLTPRLMTTVKWDIYGTCKTGKFIL